MKIWENPEVEELTLAATAQGGDNLDSIDNEWEDWTKTEDGDPQFNKHWTFDPKQS